MSKRKPTVDCAGPLQISAKRLGELALPDACERCFWLKLRLRSALPYQCFPAIFPEIDSFSKKAVHGYCDEVGRLPDWLADLGAVGYRKPPHWSQFWRLVEKHNIMLTGAPDGILVRADGSHVVIDYKTGRLTDGQDKLFPLYEVQLNGYALIGEACGFSPVGALALVYTEPNADPPGGHAPFCRPDGFQMGFTARIVNVELNPAMLDPLLARARALHDRPDPPPGRSGCEDCRRVAALARIVLPRAATQASKSEPLKWTRIEEFTELVRRQIARHPQFAAIRPESIVAYGSNRDGPPGGHGLYELSGECEPEPGTSAPHYFVKFSLGAWNMLTDGEKDSLVQAVLTRIGLNEQPVRHTS